MRILLVGEESAGMQLLKELAPMTHPDGPHEIVGVLASPELGAAKAPSVWRLAETMGLRTWPAALVKDADFASTLAAEEIDVLLNVHSLHVIHEAVLATARLGAFNLHPGPLPQYAGLNAPSWAIYNDETSHAVTLHKMVAGVDRGPVVYEARFPIDEGDSALAVYAKCRKLGIPLILRLLEQLESDPEALPLACQDAARWHCYGREVPEGGRLNWSQPARRIVNFVRACDFYPFPSPWGAPTARLDGREIGILKASRTGRAVDAPPGTVTECEAQGMSVAGEDEAVRVGLINLDGKVMPAPKLLKLGQRLEAG